jgi:hypothetical protein
VRIALEQFGGMMPRMAPRLLPETAASFASNAKLTNGSLRGFRSPRKVAALALPVGMTEAGRAFPIYRPDGSLYFFPRGDRDASLVRSPVTGDQFHRWYWTEPGQPPRYAPLAQMELGIFFQLGLPKPTAAPNVVATGGGGGGALQTARAYLYTYVDQYGAESAPSPAALVTGLSDQTFTVSGWVNIATPEQPIAKVRVYRTVAGQQNTLLFFVAEQPVTTPTYADIRPDNLVALEAVLPSLGWLPPPPDLQGLVAHASGFLAGFVGRDVYLSEPYRPHAWPATNIITLQEDVVALAPLGDAIVALTKAYPIVLTGSTPSAVTPVAMNDVQPCLSPASVVAFGDTVVFASPNGLVAVSTGGVQLLTNQLVTREEWVRDYSPVEVIAARYGPYYVAVTSRTQGWAFAGSYEPATLTRLDRLQNVDGLETDPHDGRLYVLNLNVVSEFDAVNDRRMAVTWASKEFVSPKPVNFGALQVDYDETVAEDEPEHDAIDAATRQWNLERFAYPTDLIGDVPIGSLDAPVPLRLVEGDGFSFTPPVEPLGGEALFETGALFGSDVVRVTVVADGKEVFSKPVDNGREHRLPSGFKARSWRLEVASNRTVNRIVLAETGKGLAVG